MKKNKQQQSMLETAYEIMRKHKQSMSICDLLKNTCKIHNIKDFNESKVLNQLYLDIVLSGKFVFYEEKQLIIKENNQVYWDKDFFKKIPEQPDETNKTEDNDLDFDDFIIEEDKTNNKKLEKKENIIKDEEIKKEAKIDEVDIIEEEENDYDASLEEYEYIYDKE